MLVKTLKSASPTPRTRSASTSTTLYVKRITVDGAPTAKRFLPRAHGRATHVRKRTSHVTIVVDERQRGVGRAMGQKVHPKGFRLGVIESWDSKWFARREYASCCTRTSRLRKFIKERLYHAGISKVEIERAANKAKINIYTARPGIVIGKKGAEIEKLKSELGKLTEQRVLHQHPRGAPARHRRAAGGRERRPAARAPRRLPPRDEGSRRPRRCAWARRASRCSAPAGSAAPRSRAREWYREGRVPLHTLRADISYGFAEAKTTYGVIGVKVWIFRGEVLTRHEEEQQTAALGV